MWLRRLGLGDYRPRAEPHCIPFLGVLDLTRVSLVAAGWYHAAALTDVGLLYTGGSGADGAQGHGNTNSEHHEIPKVSALLDPPISPFAAAWAAFCIAARPSSARGLWSSL